MLALSCGAWGLSFPGGKVFMAALNQELPGRNSWLFSALTIGGRFALGAIVLWLLQPSALRLLTGSEWRQAFGLGLTGGLGMLVQMDGLVHTEASTSAFPRWLRSPGSRLVSNPSTQNTSCGAGAMRSISVSSNCQR